MTGVQEKLMILMDEINDICQKEQLRYVLIHETAVRAQKKHAFSDSGYEFHLLMPMQDIEKLQNYTRTYTALNRVFESWEDNGQLRQMFFRYVDKNSLLIDVPSGNYYKKPGIAVTIYPARLHKPSAGVLGAERYLMQINSGTNRWWRTCFCYLLARSRKTRGNKKAVQYQADLHMLGGRCRYLFGGRDGLAQWIMRRQDVGEMDTDGSYWYMRWDSRLVQLPETIFTDVEWIEFEGRKLCISEHLEQYQIEDHPAAKPRLSGSIRVISECDLPYEEYLAFIRDKEGPTLEQMTQDYRDYHVWMGKVHNPMAEKVRHTFLTVRRSVDRIDTWYFLQDKREAIRTAYQNRDVERLSDLLDEYLTKTDFYLKEKIGFYIDEELFACAKLVWESRGKMKYADRVYRLVPELYKKERVDEYLARH